MPILLCRSIALTIATIMANNFLSPCDSQAPPSPLMLETAVLSLDDETPPPPYSLHPQKLPPRTREFYFGDYSHIIGPQPTTFTSCLDASLVPELVSATPQAFINYLDEKTTSKTITPKSTDSFKRTPLHLVIEHTARPTDIIESDQTISCFKFEDVVQGFIARHFTLESAQMEDVHGNTPVHLIACQQIHATSLIKVEGIFESTHWLKKNRFGMTPLAWLIISHQNALLKHVLDNITIGHLAKEQKFELNKITVSIPESDKEYHLMMLACMCNNWQAVHILCEQGSPFTMQSMPRKESHFFSIRGKDIEEPMTDSNGFFPIEHAAWALKQDQYAADGEFILCLFASNNALGELIEANVNITKITELLKNPLLKFSLNTKDPRGDTLMHKAVKKQKEDLVSCLLENKAQPYALNNELKTPLGLCSTPEFRQKLEALIEEIF